ncbi:RecB family exonuclease [Glycomyces mayteni]|uniref:RecB family exonuclease n=1 Tax=Glycomyces mayteni TaxID=543887 RepID=A0ABW2D4R8_9ACTN|nr:hypothetical protein GCM10025732_48130 [Glycomyces mayteni]
MSNTVAAHAHTPMGENRRRGGPGNGLTILSHSQKGQLEDCPRQWWLQRVARDQYGDKLKPLTAAWFDQGTAEHHALQYWELSGRTADAVQLFYDEFDRLIAQHLASHPWESEWVRGGRGKTRQADIDKRREVGAEQVARYVEWAPLQPFRVWTLPDGEPALEVGFKVMLGSVTVIGYIDAVWEWTDTGRIEPVDYKSGSKEPATDEQLGLYARVLEALFGITITHGRFMMLKDWDYRERDLSMYTREHLTELYAEAERVKLSGDYPAKPGSCFTCMMKKHCSDAV